MRNRETMSAAAASTTQPLDERLCLTLTWPILLPAPHHITSLYLGHKVDLVGAAAAAVAVA